MAVDKSTQQRLMRERAKALATLVLTRRPGVAVEDITDGIGVDLLARFVPRRKAGLRQLGVELRYALEPITVERANKVVRSALRAHQSSGPFPFPVVLLFFNMRDERAWYTWVAAPVLSDDGRVQLPLQTDPDCRLLDDEALSAILQQVDRWYDAHYEVLMAAGGTRGSGT